MLFLIINTLRNNFIYIYKMTAYHGGKQKIGKHIAEIIYDESTNVDNFTIRGYCEPFCGMLGVYQHIPDMFEDHRPKLKYKAGDLNKSVIAMWNQTKKGWNPPTKKVSKTEFERLKKAPISSPKKGFVGHIQSYRGKYFGGYFPRPSDKTYATAAKKVKEISKKLKNVSFTYGPYTQFSKLKNYIIYCDPPYEDTQQYYRTETKERLAKFDSGKFWDWCRLMAKDNIIFISGYSAPSGRRNKYIEKIWSKGKEKLYMMY